MDKKNSIEPKNLTAQLNYRGAGNPPSSHPSTAVSNAFPGLEMDFRNIWKHVLEGIVLQEYDNLVIGTDPGADSQLQRLTGDQVLFRLITVDDFPMTARVSGPSKHGRQTINTTTSLEWSNAFADILPKAGEYVECKFQNENNPREILNIKLKVRHFFDVDCDNKGKVVNRRIVISRAMGGPGDLTQSLCSPWQNDYRECGCYYWAASRPDYVNVEPGKNGKSTGNNWMEKNRDDTKPAEYLQDDFANVRLISYQDLFIAWEKELRFIIAGKDETFKKSRGSKKNK